MLNEINFGYKIADNQKDLFTPNHRRYIVTLSVNGGNDFVTTYQCNKKMHPTIENVMECLISDSLTYESFKDEFDFMYEFEYDTPEKARQVYTACKNTYMWFENEWTKEQFYELYDEVGV